MSGCEDTTFCKSFENKLKQSYPELTDDVIVVSDTLAPIALACQSGYFLIFTRSFFTLLILMSE